MDTGMLACGACILLRRVETNYNRFLAFNELLTLERGAGGVLFTGSPAIFIHGGNVLQSIDGMIIFSSKFRSAM